jgi:hypothetical protein
MAEVRQESRCGVAFAPAFGRAEAPLARLILAGVGDHALPVLGLGLAVVVSLKFMYRIVAGGGSDH